MCEPLPIRLATPPTISKLVKLVELSTHSPPKTECSRAAAVPYVLVPVIHRFCAIELMLLATNITTSKAHELPLDMFWALVNVQTVPLNIPELALFMWVPAMNRLVLTPLG